MPSLLSPPFSGWDAAQLCRNRTAAIARRRCTFSGWSDPRREPPGGYSDAVVMRVSCVDARAEVSLAAARAAGAARIAATVASAARVLELCLRLDAPWTPPCEACAIVQGLIVLQ